MKNQKTTFDKSIKKLKSISSRLSKVPLRSVCAGVGATFFVTYLLLVGQTVFQAIDEKAKNAEVREITMEVAKLEGEYLNLVRGVNKEKANTLGLLETKEISYVTISDTFSLADTSAHAF